MGKIDDIFINLDHHGFEEAVVKKITMVDLLNDEISSLLDARLKDEIKKLQQENKQLKEQLAIREKALEIADEQFNSINYRYFDESNVDFKSEWLEQAKESIK